MLRFIGSRLDALHLRRTIVALAVTAMTLGVATTAEAEEPTDYCQKVVARAEADAALLYAPTVHAQVIRFPGANYADTSGLQIGRGVQPRASVSIGLVDIYKGVTVVDAAKADCLRQKSATNLEELLAQRADVGRLPALERKLAFSREQKKKVDDIVRTAEERFVAHTATLSEVQELRLHALAFTRHMMETEQEIALLKVRAPSPKGATSIEIADAVRAYEQRTVNYEESVNDVRALAPWKLTLSGGVAASPQVDVFGVAELSYNIGGLFQSGSDRKALEARAQELKNARYEMRQQVDIMMKELRTSAEATRKQAQILETEIARITRDRASLEGTDAPNKHTVVDAMTLELIDLESEHAFLTTLADKQAAFGGDR